MTIRVPKTEARQAVRRTGQERVLLMSLGLGAVALAALTFTFIAVQPV